MNLEMEGSSAQDTGAGILCNNDSMKQALGLIPSINVVSSLPR